MPVRAVCKPHSPDLKRGALATDARGCSLWRSLLECPPPATLVRTRVRGGVKCVCVSVCVCVCVCVCGVLCGECVVCV